MADLVNLRMVRKRAKRRQHERRANAVRLAHGQPKQQRQVAVAQLAKAARNLDGHQVDEGDGR